jgi:hypothetical protein
MSESEFVQRKGAQDMLDMQEGFVDMLGDRARDQRDALMGVTMGMLLRLSSLDRYQLLSRWAATGYPGSASWWSTNATTGRWPAFRPTGTPS